MNDPLPGFTFTSTGVRADDGMAMSDCSAHNHSRKFVLTAERFGNVFSGRRKESVSGGGQRVVIHSGPGSGKFFLGLRGSPISSIVSLNSGVKMKKFWGTMKNPRERTMADSLATGCESPGNMPADGF